MRGAGWKEVSDEALIEAAKSGDERAFTTLVRRYEDTVYKFSYKVCREKEKAEETLQDTFINVFRKLDSFDGKSRFSTWLYTIVANNCLMKRRRRKSDQLQESLEAYDEPPSGQTGKHPTTVAREELTPVDLLLQQELQSLLDAAILKLPLDYRLVFVLRDLEGKSTEETASIARISVEATKSRLRRARAFLRNELQTYHAAQGASQ